MAESVTPALAEAIHDSVRVGKLGENSTHLTEHGHSVRLTPGEAQEAAERMAPWLTKFEQVVVDAERSRAASEPRRISRAEFDIAGGHYRASNGRGRSVALEAALNALGIEVEQ